MARADVMLTHMTGSDPSMPMAVVAVTDTAIGNSPANGPLPVSTQDTTGSDPDRAAGGVA